MQARGGAGAAGEAGEAGVARLEYSVHAYSSYSAAYTPENILVSKPSDQSSRWFTDSNTPAQYLVLKLKSPAVVKSITFGKYIKHHVSDLKRFTILGGTDDTNLTTLLSAGLKNDSSSETFQLRHRTVEGLQMPILYLKIVPLQSWGPAYNYTIWYVELHGIIEERMVQSALYTISLRKEEEAIRILLKHLRTRHYTAAFEALSRETGVRLEGHTQARLWNALVENGDYDLAEQTLEGAVRDGELDWYISWQPYKPSWTQISACSGDTECRCASQQQQGDNKGPVSTPVLPVSAPAGPIIPPETVSPAANNGDVSCSDRDCTLNGSAPNNMESESCDSSYGGSQASCSCKPGPRGGHQLVVDSSAGSLYLFGGWDGAVDLDDLWVYNISTDRWRLLCRHSALVGGPSPRSCHKMVLDPTRQRIYTLGRYLDNALRTPDNMKSDLYVFDISSCEWTLICADTATTGGPGLVFDHQMCIDPDTQTIYLFGGRLLPNGAEEVPKYSGLYAYYIETNSWQLLLPEDQQPDTPSFRVGHSMLFHPIQRRLYIFAGQRNREHLLDMWWWDVETSLCGALAPLPSPPRPPSVPNFTQRATLDPDTDEIFVLSGLNKEKDKRVCNTLWVFSLRRGTWTCAYRNEFASIADPQPRFAHQLVYDATEKVHYLFGGHPGNIMRPKVRLNDLWALRLSRPPVTEVLRRAKQALREAKYWELVAQAMVAPSIEPSVTAVNYLRERVYRTIDHTDPEQVEHFTRLPTALFAGLGPPDIPMPSLTPALTRRLARRKARAGYSCISGSELSRALAAVLGAEDTTPDQPKPFDDVLEPEYEPSDIGDISEGESDDMHPAGEVRANRVKLYVSLAQYFRPSMVPPKADVMDLVKF